MSAYISENRLRNSCKFQPKRIIVKTVNLQLSDFEFDELGLNKNTLLFSELIEIIERKITKRTLEKSMQLADKYGLSKMTMEQIDDEIKAQRNEENNS
ncbi:hypothetical protein C8N25_10278 [Algoriphagus antarcticus]|uniref:Uncharacterized protein n=1 Tax=Algoriphagus antarcticus TaxID=238540 RepID=A0A3E0E375_9BACT|nr:hypothetical protein C8N25_10278 [Algoriphagus antarcticus]